MKPIQHIISMVSVTFATVLCAVAVYSTPAFAGKNDPSNGQCDEFSGKTKAVCRQAHRFSNKIERLKERGSSLEALRDAEQELEKRKNRFFSLTGLPVPGLTLPCEIPDINDWVERNQNRPDQVLPNPTISYPDNANNPICRITYELDPTFAESSGCTVGSILTIIPDAYNFREYGFATDGNGNPVSCGFSFTFFLPADMLQLEACAISLGCDVPEPQ